MERNRILRYHGFLPHESAFAALGGSMAETGFGANTGGTAPAAANMVRAFYENAFQMMQEVNGQNYNIFAYLDSPRPRRGMDIGSFPFGTITYELPYIPGRTFKDVWEMKDVYMSNPDWVREHRAFMTQGGLMLHGLEHTLGMELGNILMQHANDRDLHRVISRAHSPFRVYVQQENPEYYSARYAGTPGENYFLDVQRTALQASDLILFPTEIERMGTIDAVVQAGITSREDIEKRTHTIGIPVDLRSSLRFSRFNPMADANLQAEYGLSSRRKLREEQMNLINAQIRTNLLSGVDPGYFGAYLDLHKNYMTYCGRLDKEKGIFDAVMAYADFLEANDGKQEDFATFLVIGGLSQKEGNRELFDNMIRRIHTLPDHLKQHFVITGKPMPHEWVSAISALEIYPSEEESFNMAEKEARATGTVVALSEVSGHKGTNIKGEKSTEEDTAIWFRPIPGDWKSYAPAFFAAQNPLQYDHIAYNGYQHVQQFSSERVCRELLSTINQKYPGYFLQ